MKRGLLFLIVIIVGCLSMSAQKYAVDSKKGKTRVTEYELVNGKWNSTEVRNDIYIENGYEFVAVPPVAKDTIVMEYEGKYYRVIFPKEDLMVVDGMGQPTYLGYRNTMRHTFIGAFYKTKLSGLICLGCAAIAFLAFVISIFRDKIPMFLRWLFALPMSIISFLELVAICTVGDVAYWFVNPDDVGYFIAILMLIPYSFVIALQVFAYSLYDALGEVDDPMDGWFKFFIGFGIALAILSAISVVLNFIWAICFIIGLGAFLAIGNTGYGTIYKDSYGNKYQDTLLGKRKID